MATRVGRACARFFYEGLLLPTKTVARIAVPSLPQCAARRSRTRLLRRHTMHQTASAACSATAGQVRTPTSLAPAAAYASTATETPLYNSIAATNAGTALFVASLRASQQAQPKESKAAPATRATTSAAAPSSDAPSNSATTSGGDTSSITPAPVSANAVTISSFLASIRGTGNREGSCRNGSERGDSLDEPEAREAADGIRRDAPEPRGLWQSEALRRAPANRDDCQRGRDEHQLANLDADVEEQQRNRDRRLRQADFRERAGETESVHRPERERHHPRPACGDPGPATVHLDDLARDKENAQRDAGLDRWLRDVDPAEGGGRQRQAVRRGKRRHRDDDAAPASDED